MKWKESCRLIKSDVSRRLNKSGQPLSKAAFMRNALSPASMAVILFRLQHYFYTNNLRIVAKLIAVANIILFSVEIGSRCDIDEGFCLGHPNGVTIHDNTRIGKNCTIMHQAAFGFKQLDRIQEDASLVLEDDVFIGAGAKLLGPLTIGKGCIVGMNSLVFRSFPPGSLIIGTPAKRVSTLSKEEWRPAAPSIGGGKPACTFAGALRLIREDLANRARTDGKSFSRSAYFRLFFNPPALAVVVFRISHLLEGYKLALPAKLLDTLNLVMFKTEIDRRATIGGGLVLLHSNGIRIDHKARIGRNVVFAHQNTVSSGSGAKTVDDHVAIGDNTFIGAGAKIIGSLSIGAHCMVAMNEVVTKSAEAHSILKKGTNHPRRLSKSGSRVTDQWTCSPGGVSIGKTLALFKADILRRACIEGKKAGLFYCLKLILNPPMLAVALFRFSHFFACKGWHPVAKVLCILNTQLFNIEIASKARIGPGLVLAHANGIFINERTIIGKNCTFTLHNSVTVGPHSEGGTRDGPVILGDDITVGMGARIIGPLRLGSRTIISANAVVCKDACEEAVLTGAPARQVEQMRGV